MDNLSTPLIPPKTLALDTASAGLAAPPLPGFVSAIAVLLAESPSTLVPPTHSPTHSFAALRGNSHALDHYKHITEELEKLPKETFNFSLVLAKKWA
ncbi:hypothetical protein GOP47_0027697 [Adiantum capillus-veneris]|nr:hypothetical protein GOP47_0027697 [Adiantum capillus-veneris]